MPYLLGIDIGTSGTKTLLIDESGRVVASATAEYELLTPRPGWSEQRPEDWWDATCATCREVLARSGVRAEEIAGIGLSGQMHGSVFLDASGQVIRPALLWNDQRTARQCVWMTETVGQRAIVETLANPVLTGFQAPKVLWLRDEEPENFARVSKVLLPKDYIRWKLSGVFAGEVSDASGTSLFNVRARDWAEDVMQAVGLPRAWFPDVAESWEPTARVSVEAARATGLAEGTPIVGGGGDQAAGAVGNGIVEPGIISISLGTSGVIFAYAPEPAVDPGLRVHSMAHAVPGAWHIMGCVLSAGGSLRWLRDVIAQPEIAVSRLLGHDPYELLSAEAALAPAGSEGLIFLPYLTGERTPHADPDARGVFFGLSLRHDKRHLTRAVMEGAAYGLRDSFEILREMNVPVRQVRISGGGARSLVWRQIFADVTGLPQTTINVDEGPAFGVALLAGVGAGVWPSVPDACRATIAPVAETPPHPEAVEVYERYYAIYRDLYPTLKPLYARNAAAVAAAG